MPRWAAELLRRPFRPLASAALLTLAPKCAMCVLAYGGVGALLGLRGPEICGATVGSQGSSALWLTVFRVALGFLGMLAGVRCLLNSIRNRRRCS
jgi:hypothetical protein